MIIFYFAHLQLYFHMDISILISVFEKHIDIEYILIVSH